MQANCDPETASITRGLLRESKTRLGEAALDYVLDARYKDAFATFDEYLKADSENHHVLPHYYVTLLDREDENFFLTGLSNFLQDLLFYDSLEVHCLKEIKSRLLKVAVLDRAPLISVIRELFDIYDKLNAISVESWQKQQTCFDLSEKEKIRQEANQRMYEIVKDHPYAGHWVRNLGH